MVEPIGAKLVTGWDTHWTVTADGVATANPDDRARRRLCPMRLRIALLLYSGFVAMFWACRAPPPRASTWEVGYWQYDYGAFLADHSERVFFNDLLWSGFQRYAYLSSPSNREGKPALLGDEASRALLENERRFKDAQEERWQAYLVLDRVVEAAGHSSLGERAARKAIECLERIRTDRFERDAEIKAGRQRLIGWLRQRPS